MGMGVGLGAFAVGKGIGRQKGYGKTLWLGGVEREGAKGGAEGLGSRPLVSSASGGPPSRGTSEVGREDAAPPLPSPEIGSDPSAGPVLAAAFSEGA